MSRRALGGLMLGIALLSGLVSAAPAAAEPTRRTAIPLDGFLITHVPDGAGGLESTFDYEWEEVTFHSRVWETGPDPDGGHRVDLTITTLRGETLSDLEAARRFLTGYYEYDADQWKLRRLRIGRYRGYLAADRAFWSVSPGVAVAVTIDRSRFPRSALITTARGIRPTCMSTPQRLRAARSAHRLTGAKAPGRLPPLEPGQPGMPGWPQVRPGDPGMPMTALGRPR